MTTPYWGSLPKASSDTRQPASRQPPPTTAMDPSGSSQPQQRSNRASVQTTRTTNTDAPTESTMSPFASPTTSSFAGQGLAPRPPSYPYDASQHADFAERRQRRRSRKSEESDPHADAPTPPAAPDVPKAPPSSHRGPYAAGANGPGYGPPRGSQRGNQNDYYHQEAQQARRRSGQGPAVTPSGPEAAEPASVQPKKAAVSRRVSTNDRSPLQKLEVRLDTLSKEEKRARAEAAERKARERAAGANPDLLQPPGNQPRQRAQPPPQQMPPSQSAQQQQVRFNERKPSFEEGDDSGRRAVLAPQAAAVQRSTSRSQRAQPVQAPAENGKRYFSEPQQQPRAAGGAAYQEPEQGVPQRNLSFRERAVKNDMKIPITNSVTFSDESPQATPPAPAPAPAKSGFSLTRSGSNKLRKEPPGDPWYSRRLEMEKKYNKIDSPTNGMGNTSAVVGGAAAAAALPRSTSLRDKPLPPEPFAHADDTSAGQPYQEDAPRGAIPSKAARVMGFGGLQRRATAPTSRTNSYDTYDQPRQQQEQPTSNHLGPVAGGVAAAAVQAASRPDPRGRQGPDDYSSDEEQPIPDRGSHMVYAKKGEQIGPGRGLYLPPQYLEEWKKAQIGLLGGTLLELSDEPPQPTTQDKSTPWWEGGGSRRRSSAASRPRAEGELDGTADAPTQFKPALYLKCGPLLRYCGIRQDKTSPHTKVTADREVWRGSVMIVTQDSQSSYDIVPTLRLFAQPLELLPPPPQEISGDNQLPPEYVDPIAGLPKLGRRGETLYVRPVEHLEEAKDLSKNETDDGLFERIRSPVEYHGRQASTDLPGSFAGRRKRSPVDGEKLSKYKDVRGFRLHAERGYTFWRFNIEVELGQTQQRIAYRINRGPAMGFWVPARGQSMNIMFHSCNGFSMSVNPDELSGPDPMWRDVLNTHQTQPFHVMIGGGDQIYNDCLIGQSKLFNEWLEIRNPFHKRKALFTPTMQDELETLYLERYCMWFSQGLFGLANSQIPMVNMWDDHDISDGYGSYPHLEQNSPAFSGLGSVAFKYYMLFQHQSLPTETGDDEPSWLLSQKPGPYIRELGRSLYMSLGAKVALLAVDARTERTEVDVVAEDTWKLIMDRCYDEIKSGTTDHLLVLLGVPIAYPRLVWLENILTSRLMDPVKAMGKLGFLGSALNKIDGGVEVMDDLNDHWTARNHKKERAYVIEDLQDLAADKSVRITILSGDVHLAAVGQFYANPKLGLPKHKDFRYMPNVISSAIANTPPPNLLADVLNRRNKIHHFDDNTDESMIPLFHQGVDGKARNNKHLLPHRNWCSIRAWTPGMTPPPTPPIPGYDGAQAAPVQKQSGGVMRRLSKSRPESRPEPTRGRDSRPPISGEGKFGGLMRRLSSRRRKDPEAPQHPPPAQLTRTMSLTRADFGPRNLFSRKPSKGRPNDGGINGNWGGSESGNEEYYDAYDQPRSPPTPPRDGHLRLRGGSGRAPYEEFTPGDEDYFTTRPPPRAPQQRQPPQQAHHDYPHGRQQSYQDTPPEPPAPIIKPFHRTPTGLSTKQLKKGGAEKFNVDLEGGLDITLNVEVNPRDPAGITVPYRLLVPRLFWDDATEGATLQQPAPTGFKRFLSFKKKQGPPHGHGDGPQSEETSQPAPVPVPVSASQERAGGGGWGQWAGQVPDQPVQQQRQLQQPAPTQHHQQHARHQSLPGWAAETQPRTHSHQQQQQQKQQQQHHTPQRYHQPQHSAPYPQHQGGQAVPPAGRDTRYYDDDDYDSAEDDAQYQTYERR